MLSNLDTDLEKFTRRFKERICTEKVVAIIRTYESQGEKYEGRLVRIRFRGFNRWWIRR